MSCDVGGAKERLENELCFLCRILTDLNKIICKDMAIVFFEFEP